MFRFSGRGLRKPGSEDYACPSDPRPSVDTPIRQSALIPGYPVGLQNYFCLSVLSAFTSVRTGPMQFLVPPLAVIVEDDQLQRDALANALAGVFFVVFFCCSVVVVVLLVSRIGLV